MQELDTTNQTLKLPNFGFNLPELMPDEFFLGLFGRFSQLNGYENSHFAKIAISTKFKQLHPELTTVPAIFGIARIYGMDLNDLVRQTTLIHLQAKVSKVVDQSEGKNELSNLKVIIRRGVGLMKKHPCLCLKCVKEDTNYWGFSYWRRSHQLPGVDYCTKHNAPLIELDNQDAFNRLPSWHIANYHGQEHQISIPSHFQQKFSELINDACEINFTLNHKFTKSLLVEALTKKLGPRPSSFMYHGLDRLMTEQLPLDWMKKHFPKLVSTYEDLNITHYRNMLEACSSHKLFIHYILMAAVIFDSADEAIINIVNAHSESSLLKPKLGLCKSL